MKLLFLNFGAYTYIDIAAYFKRSNISFDVASYSFSDKNKDDFFRFRFIKMLSDTDYDAVFSVNYFPIVAECCYRKNIKYISWSYDNPLNVTDIDRTLGYETNYVFLFDRIQVENYVAAGFKTVYHMPLAVDADRLAGLKVSNADINKYKSQISFVGKLYESDYPMLVSYMSEYQRGFVEGAVKAQGQLYGAYILDSILTDKLIADINNTYADKLGPSKLVITREALSYAMAAETTRQERLLLLGLLSKHFELKIYSRENHSFLADSRYMGSCRYLDEMPKVFKLSDINLNINLKISQSGVPLRVMDVLGSGGFLISSWQPEVYEYFGSNNGAVMYESIEDAYDKSAYYLKHDDLRAEIARNGLQIVNEFFSYDSQFAKIFNIAGINL